jgi:nitrogen fixation NifU-like protein
MMTVKAKGRSVQEAKALSAQVREMLVGSECEPPRELGDLASLSGVRKFPARIKCALLPWRTLEAALDGRGMATSE